MSKGSINLKLFFSHTLPKLQMLIAITLKFGTDKELPIMYTSSTIIIMI